MFILVMIHMTKITKDSKNIHAPEACASQWVEDVITLEETIDCIDNYMGQMNNTKRGSRNYNS